MGIIHKNENVSAFHKTCQQERVEKKGLHTFQHPEQYKDNTYHLPRNHCYHYTIVMLSHYTRHWGLPSEAAYPQTCLERYRFIFIVITP